VGEQALKLDLLRFGAFVAFYAGTAPRTTGFPTNRNLFPKNKAVSL
jgi:hypothetical protein